MWILPRHRFKFIVAALVALAIGYVCLSKYAAPGISGRFAEVSVSDTREHVRELLGEPEGRERSHIPSGHYWGPTEGLASILQPGAPYEQWQWSDERDTYLVWFASNSEQPPEEWLVVAKARYPTGAVF